MPCGGRMVPWLCIVALRAVLCARDVGTSVVYWMSGAEASYFVAALLKIEWFVRQNNF
jgi:hypothetical protein